MERLLVVPSLYRDQTQRCVINIEAWFSVLR